MANLNIINDIRKEKKLTWDELAEKTGISTAGLKRIVARNSTQIETLEKIADVLEVNISAFFSQENSSKESSNITNKNLNWYKQYCYEILQRKIGTTQIDSAWLSLIEITKEFENVDFIDKDYELCEQQSLFKILSEPEIEIEKLESVWKKHFELLSWQYENLYKTSNQYFYDSYTKLIGAGDVMEHHKFILYVEKQGDSNTPDAIINQFKEKLAQFLEYLKPILANFASEKEIYRELASLGILSKLYTDNKYIKHYLMDINRSRMMLMNKSTRSRKKDF